MRALILKRNLELKEFDIIENIEIPRFIKENEILEIYKENEAKIERVLRAKYIFLGSNKFHHLSFFLLLKEKPKKYILIDQHPDDFSLKDNLNSGSFIKYIKKFLDIDIYYIGFIKPENPNIFKDFFIIRKDRGNFNNLFKFIERLPKEMYASIDLDIINSKYIKSYNNNYSFLLTKEEFKRIMEYIKNKCYKFDICGFVKDIPNWLFEIFQ